MYKERRKLIKDFYHLQDEYLKVMERGFYTGIQPIHLEAVLKITELQAHVYHKMKPPPKLIKKLYPRRNFILSKEWIKLRQPHIPELRSILTHLAFNTVKSEA